MQVRQDIVKSNIYGNFGVTLEDQEGLVMCVQKALSRMTVGTTLVLTHSNHTTSMGHTMNGKLWHYDSLRGELFTYETHKNLWDHQFRNVPNGIHYLACLFKPKWLVEDC